MTTCEYHNSIKLVVYSWLLILTLLPYPNQTSWEDGHLKWDQKGKEKHHLLKVLECGEDFNVMIFEIILLFFHLFICNMFNKSFSFAFLEKDQLGTSKFSDDSTLKWISDTILYAILNVNHLFICVSIILILLLLLLLILPEKLK